MKSRTFQRVAYSLLVVAAIVCAGQADCRQPFTVILLPDTQHYTRWTWRGGEPVPKYPDFYDSQTQWIVNHQEIDNIKFTIHLGDLTHNYDLEPLEWSVVDQAHAILDAAGAPYSVLPGNHDLRKRSGDVLTHHANGFDATFPPERFGDWSQGHFGASMANNYAFFDASGLEFMVISLEHAPRKDQLCWAEEVVRKHDERRVIVATHCYQTNGGGRTGSCDGNYHIVGADGHAIWRELVSRHSNIFMVVSGHINGSEYKPVTATIGDTSYTVHQILTDYQDEHYGNSKCGNGWLRKLRFLPYSNKVRMSVVSTKGYTEFNQTGYFADPKRPFHKYTFNCDMGPAEAAVHADNQKSSGFGDRLVNVGSSGDQKRPRIAMSPAGHFVLVWQDGRHAPSADHDIYARVFDAHGCQVEDDVADGQYVPRDFKVSGDTPGHRTAPQVAMDAEGNFMVVWNEKQPDGQRHIYVRAFDVMGREIIEKTRLDSYSPLQQPAQPAVAMADLQHAVVVWVSKGGENVTQIRQRKFNGVCWGSTFLVNSTFTGVKKRPAVAMDAEGNYVVVWQDDSDGNGKWQIHARGWGTPEFAFPEKTVNQVATGNQITPDVAMSAEGDYFAVVWVEKDNPSREGVWMHGYWAGGQTRFFDMPVASDDVTGDCYPALAMDEQGQLFVAWQRYVVEVDPPYSVRNYGWEIWMRPFKHFNQPLRGDTRINEVRRGPQQRPDIAAHQRGTFVTVWEDDLEKNDVFEVYAAGWRVDDEGHIK